MAQNSTVKMKGVERLNKIIFASHGELSIGLLDSVKMIVGDLANGVETFSLYPGENPNDYFEFLKQEIEQCKNTYIILCDIKGGSVHTALSRLCSNENITVMSGMNLNMAIDVVLTYRNQLNEEDINTLILSSMNGITGINSSRIENSVDEDF